MPIEPQTGTPATTVPYPRAENARSTGSRKMPSSGLGCRESSRRVNVCIELVEPFAGDARDGADGRVGQERALQKRPAFPPGPSRGVPASTRSIFVSATKPWRTPSKVRISRCSRVCGITPSSAATTSITASMPQAPATIVLMKFSCPGTSTIPISRSPTVQGANPRSIEMPRSFSALSRSVSQPVSSLTRAVLPWSMCPAVPRVMLIWEPGMRSLILPCRARRPVRQPERPLRRPARCADRSARALP